MPALARRSLTYDLSVPRDATRDEAAATEGISLDRLDRHNRERDLRIVWHLDDAGREDWRFFGPAPSPEPIEGSDDLVGWKR
jgi:hypothetical protein